MSALGPDSSSRTDDSLPSARRLVDPTVASAPAVEESTIEQRTFEATKASSARHMSAPVSSTLYRLLGLALFVAAWYAGAAAMGSRFFPFPHEVIFEFIDIVTSGIFLENLTVTVARVSAGFGGALVLSVVVGILMGLFKKIEALLEGFVLIGLTIPSLVWSLLSVMWFGLSETSAIFAIIVIMSPYLVLNVWEGTRALDNKLTQMAETFGARRLQIVRHIVIPHLGPYLFAGARIGFSLAWKVVVIVELLGQSNGVGYQLNRSYNLFSIEGVLAWTFGFMLVMAALEFGVFRRLERHVTRWKLT